MKPILSLRANISEGRFRVPLDRSTGGGRSLARTRLHPKFPETGKNTGNSRVFPPLIGRQIPPKRALTADLHPFRSLSP